MGNHPRSLGLYNLKRRLSSQTLLLGHDLFLPITKLRECTPLPGVRLAIFSKLVFEELRVDWLSVIVSSVSYV